MTVTINGSTGLVTPGMTLGSSVVDVPSGSAPSYLCRAWVNFNGTSTVAIRASGNVTSITDNGTGDYTINFTTAISDANYTFVGMEDPVSNGGNGLIQKHYDHAPTTTALRIRSVNPGTGFFDTAFACVSIFR